MYSINVHWVDGTMNHFECDDYVSGGEGATLLLLNGEAGNKTNVGVVLYADKMKYIVIKEKE